MKSIGITISLFATWILPLTADAVLLTDSADMPNNAPTIDFSQFAPAGRIRFDAGDPPIEIDAIHNETVLLRPISGTSTVAIILGDHTPPQFPSNSFFLGTNGHWGPGRTGFLGIGGGNGSRVVARIEFASGPVSFVGGLFNYSPDPRWLPVLMTALDENLAVIEQHVLNTEAPISTFQQTDAGVFRGIMRDQADIFAIEISASFAVMDDIRFSRIIPEPGALDLSALAILSAVLKLRAKRHHRQRSQ